MNLPNALTLLRFMLIPVYIAVFANGYLTTAFFVMAGAGLTDVLDGYLARRNGEVTRLGMMLDPLADKLMLITVFVSLVLSGMISWWAAIALLLRDLGMIVVSAYVHFRGKLTLPSNWMGKLTTVLLYVAITLIFFKLPFGELMLWAVIVFSYVTTTMYLIRFRSVNNQAAG
ncbi:CDP-alcohol phosphatidyltransferase family protein [Paenibacillus sp. 1P07SE]|uniref:CDP-alcohol phosphatidyltransferase family protein n=1 Tax=Paenibacillus sp. 1P07SE TaxID=3132209 RepID=UPI0039A43FA1